MKIYEYIYQGTYYVEADTLDEADERFHEDTKALNIETYTINVYRGDVG